MPSVPDAASFELPDPGRDGKRTELVREMFDRVAPRYDLANTLLSFGQDAHWRRVSAMAAEPRGADVLDVATGTGPLARELLMRGARSVTAFDLSLNMLVHGARKALPDTTWVNGDAQRMPFPEGRFDAVTIGFGLRNIPDPERALREFARVCRPGARLVVLEFAAPTWGPFRELYHGYLMKALPRIAEVVSSSPESYEYLAQSIRAWPDRLELAQWMEKAGWEGVQVKDLSGGIVAVHRAYRR